MEFHQENFEKISSLQCGIPRDEQFPAPAEPVKVRTSFSSRDLSVKYLENTGEVYFETYTNDGSDASNESLLALKNIIAAQLPKMPKEYIVRLVFDRRHYTLAIIQNDRIVGGICYRPYYDQRFAEIAFCAISTNEQVKGYGTRLMNQLKHSVQSENIEYFLTYADNYAIGYFQKQGFTKTISMARERWHGFIKDYDGGTLMECYIHPALSFLDIPQTVATQRTYIQDLIQETSKSNIRYPGLKLFQHTTESIIKFNSPIDIPGVQTGGWDASHFFVRGATERDRVMYQRLQYEKIKKAVEVISQSEHAWPFKLPVNPSEVPDYYVKIKNPIDLSMIMNRLEEGKEYYRTVDMLKADLKRMISNCKQYNDERSEYYGAAVDLEKVIRIQITLLEAEQKNTSGADKTFPRKTPRSSLSTIGGDGSSSAIDVA